MISGERAVNCLKSPQETKIESKGTEVTVITSAMLLTFKLNLICRYYVFSIRFIQQERCLSCVQCQCHVKKSCRDSYNGPQHAGSTDRRTMVFSILRKKSKCHNSNINTLYFYFKIFDFFFCNKKNKLNIYIVRIRSDQRRIFRRLMHI